MNNYDVWGCAEDYLKELKWKSYILLYLRIIKKQN